MAAANQMNGEIHDGRRHCSVYPSFAIFSIRDKGMEEKLQCHKDVTFGIVVSYETEHFAEGFGNDNAARGYGVVNCESTLEEKYIAEERYNTLCARIYRYADSAYPDGAKIIA